MRSTIASARLRPLARHALRRSNGRPRRWVHHVDRIRQQGGDRTQLAGEGGARGTRPCRDQLRVGRRSSHPPQFLDDVAGRCERIVEVFRHVSMCKTVDHVGEKPFDGRCQPFESCQHRGVRLIGFSYCRACAREAEQLKPDATRLIDQTRARLRRRAGHPDAEREFPVDDGIVDCRSDRQP